ncbi:MAG: quinone oxidoreductase [Alphaproteobacteria bacterium]|nr:quinone oxidoreductase [Alphaproteobacteria bacterium]
MVKALRALKAGGPEVLSWDDVEVGEPGAGEVRLRHTAIGVNYIDTYHRAGLHPGSVFPSILGVEGAGIVEAVGAGVSGFAVGDRVCYPLARGAYCERRLINEAILVKVPNGVSDEQAAAAITKGLTVQHLFNRSHKVKPGDWVLFHAAAGGVGLFACQWARHLNVKLIGTVSSAAKAKLAKNHGAAQVIDYTKENFVDRVKQVTGGGGCIAVYDAVGKTTAKDSIKCVATYGTLCTFGSASGASDMTIADLPPSIHYTKGSIMTLVGRRDEYRAAAGEFFDLVAKGILKISVNHTYALKDGAQAHRDLESRKTTGSIILKP